MSVSARTRGIGINPPATAALLSDDAGENHAAKYLARARRATWRTAVEA